MKIFHHVPINIYEEKMLSGEFFALRKEVVSLRERAGRVRHLEADNALLHLTVARLEHENKSLRQALSIVQRRLRDEEDRRVAEASLIGELERRTRVAASPSPVRRMSTPPPPRTLEELRMALSASPPTTPRPRRQSPQPYRSPAKSSTTRDALRWDAVEISALSQRTVSPAKSSLALSPIRRFCSTSPIRTTPVALSRRLAEQLDGATIRHGVRPSSSPRERLPVAKPPLGRSTQTCAASAGDSQSSDGSFDVARENPLARAIFY